MISGRKTVAVAGHPERLWPVPLPGTVRIEVDVLPDNTEGSAIRIGGKETHAGTGGEMGRPLWNRFDGPDSWAWNNIDPYDVWVAVSDGNEGDGVSFLLYGVDQ